VAFGNLSRALIQLFRIAAGESWIEGIPVGQTVNEGTKQNKK